MTLGKALLKKADEYEKSAVEKYEDAIEVLKKYTKWMNTWAKVIVVNDYITLYSKQCIQYLIRVIIKCSLKVVILRRKIKFNWCHIPPFL